MKTAVVLGNRMNDDATLSSACLSRLEMLLHADAAVSFDRIILSGGIANKTAGVAEADAMFSELGRLGFDTARLIKEDKSISTEENALFSAPIIKSLNPEELVIITSYGHLIRPYLNPVKLFKNALKDCPQIKISTYSETWLSRAIAKNKPKNK